MDILKELDKIEESKNKTVAPVVQSTVTVKKESEIAKFGKQIVSENVSTVTKKLKDEVFAPGIKKLIVDLGTSFFNWIIYGAGKGTPSGSQKINGLTHISYASMYDRPATPVTSTPKADLFTLDKVIFNERGDAEVVLLKLREAIARYGLVSAGDFYDMCGIQSVFTAQKYGWRDLSQATIAREGDKYYICFPKLVTLE